MKYASMTPERGRIEQISHFIHECEELLSTTDNEVIFRTNVKELADGVAAGFLEKRWKVATMRESDNSITVTISYPDKIGGKSYVH